MTTTEPIDVESTDTTPEPEATPAPPVESVEVVRHDEDIARTNQAIVAASQAALDNPGTPGAAEFMALAAQARILSLSGAAPKAVRDNPYVAFHVALVGRDLGLSPSAALELIDVIEIKRAEGREPAQYRLSLSPQLLNGQLRRLGIGSIVPAVRTPETCIAWAIGPGGMDRRCVKVMPDHVDDCVCDLLGTSEFTWDDAKMAGLVGAGCEPGAHSTACGARDGAKGMKCNQGYKTYPKRMLWWRAAGFAADDYFPEASLGLYSPEALGVPVDDEGRAIDPATVALPEGYEPAAVGTGSTDAPVAVVDWADVAFLQGVIAGATDEERDKLRPAWSNTLGRVRPEDVPAGDMKRAKALVRGMVKNVNDANDLGATAIATSIGVCLGLLVGYTAGPVAAPGGPAPAGDGGTGESGDGHTEPDPAPDAQAGDDAGDKRPRHAGQDPAAVEVAELVRAVTEGVDPALVKRITDEVAKMHHARLDKALTDAGEDIEGHHIDVRRMMLVAILVAEAADEST